MLFRHPLPQRKTRCGFVPSIIFLLTNRCVVLIDLDCFYAQVEQVRLGIPKQEPLAVDFFFTMANEKVQQWEVRCLSSSAHDRP